MPAHAFKHQITIFGIGRRRPGKNMVFPEILLQENHLLLIGLVPPDFTNNGFFLVVAIQAAEEAAVHIHDGHIVPPLGFIIDGNGFFTV